MNRFVGSFTFGAARIRIRYYITDPDPLSAPEDAELTEIDAVSLQY